MPECRCRIDTIDFRYKCWCRTYLFPGIPATAFTYSTRGLLVFLSAWLLSKKKNLMGAEPRTESGPALQSASQCTLSYAASYWAKLQPPELSGTILSCAAPSKAQPELNRAILHPTELPLMDSSSIWASISYHAASTRFCIHGFRLFDFLGFDF
jgi:hypothetical protein